MAAFEKGFYYHDKHDPAKGIFDHAYEFLNVAHDTESADYEKESIVIYRPLYEDCAPYRNGKHWIARPLKMFLEPAAKDGRTFMRFVKITDGKILGKMAEQWQKMYY